MISDLETLVLGNARSPEHLDLVVHIDVCIVFSYDNDTAAVPILYNYSQVFQVLWDFSWILHSVTTSWCQVVQDDAWGGSNKKMDVLNDWYEACCIVKQPIELKVGTLDTYRGGKILGWFPFERGVAFLLLHRTHVSLSIMSSRIWVLHAKKRSKIDQEVKKRGEMLLQGMIQSWKRTLDIPKGLTKQHFALGDLLPCQNIRIDTHGVLWQFFLSCLENWICCNW